MSKKKTRPQATCSIHHPVGTKCRILRGHVVDVGETCVVESKKDGVHRVLVTLPNGATFHSDVLGKNLDAMP